jgi:hypothetical protein
VLAPIAARKILPVGVADVGRQTKACAPLAMLAREVTCRVGIIGGAVLVLDGKPSDQVWYFACGTNTHEATFVERRRIRGIVTSGPRFMIPERDDHTCLWEDRVALNETFYAALRDHPVPLLEAAIRRWSPAPVASPAIVCASISKASRRARPRQPTSVQISVRKYGTSWYKITKRDMLRRGLDRRGFGSRISADVVGWRRT